VARIEYRIDYLELCDTFSGFLSANEVPGINQDYMTNDVLHCSFLILDMINLFMFVGNWDILTLLVIGDIMYFMLVTACGVNVMYGVMFVLVADLVVCIYVMYL